MKVYAVTYYTGEGHDITLRIYRNKKKAQEHVDLMNVKEPATKHSGGAYYNVVEWEVE